MKMRNISPPRITYLFTCFVDGVSFLASTGLILGTVDELERGLSGSRLKPIIDHGNHGQNSAE